MRPLGQLGPALHGPVGGTGHPCPEEVGRAGWSHGGPHFHLGRVWDQEGLVGVGMPRGMVGGREWGLLGLLWGEWGPAGSLVGWDQVGGGRGVWADPRLSGSRVNRWVGQALGALTGQALGELGEQSLPGALGEVIEGSARAQPVQADKFEFAELSIKGRTSVQLEETQHLLLL